MRAVINRSHTCENMDMECVEATSYLCFVLAEFPEFQLHLCYVLEAHPGLSESTTSGAKHHILPVTWWQGGSTSSSQSNAKISNPEHSLNLV